MDKDEAIHFFYRHFQTWKTGELNSFRSFFNEGFEGIYQNRPLTRTHIIDRFKYIQENYKDISLHLLNLTILNNQQYLVLARFFAIKKDTQKPIKRFLSSVYTVEGDIISQICSLSTGNINTSIYKKPAKKEGAINYLAPRDKFLQTLKLVTESLDKEITLSSVEIDCLYLYFFGLTFEEISKEIKIPVGEVKKQMNTIKEKYATTSKTTLRELMTLF